MISIAFAGLAGAIHIYIFVMESLLWGRPMTNKSFAMSAEMAEHNRLFAFNQGFYNLFLALTRVEGLYFPTDRESSLVFPSASTGNSGPKRVPTIFHLKFVNWADPEFKNAIGTHSHYLAGNIDNPSQAMEGDFTCKYTQVASQQKANNKRQKSGGKP